MTKNEAYFPTVICCPKTEKRYDVCLVRHIRASLDQNFKVFKISFFPPIDHCALLLQPLIEDAILTFYIKHQVCLIAFDRLKQSH